MNILLEFVFWLFFSSQNGLKIFKTYLPSISDIRIVKSGKFLASIPFSDLILLASVVPNFSVTVPTWSLVSGFSVSWWNI